MEKSILPTEYTVDLTEQGLDQDLQDTLSDLLIKACGKLQDGYTEVAAWSDMALLKNAGENTIHDIYRQFLGVPAHVENVHFGYKVEQDFEHRDSKFVSVFKPKLVLCGGIVSSETEGIAETQSHRVELDLLQGFDNETAQQHIYLLSAIAGESSLLGQSVSTDS